MRRKYERYIMCNFGYFDEREAGEYVSLIYTYVDNGNGQPCGRCGENLKRKLVHVFTEEASPQNVWFFGSTCVDFVFGAGLGK